MISLCRIGGRLACSGNMRTELRGRMVQVVEHLVGEHGPHQVKITVGGTEHVIDAPGCDGSTCEALKAGEAGAARHRADLAARRQGMFGNKGGGLLTIGLVLVRPPCAW